MIIKYFIKALIILFLLLVMVVTIGTSYYKKDIEDKVVIEINNRLLRPMSIRKASFSSFSNFPRLSFRMEDVVLYKSDSSNSAFLKVEKIQILFNPYNLIIGHHSISDIILTNGKVDMRVDSLGNKDFDIFLKPDKSQPKKEMDFKIHEILFSNIEFYYQNDFRPKRLHLKLTHSKASVGVDSEKIKMSLKGDMYSYQFKIRPGILFENSDMHTDFHMSFDRKNKIFEFHHCVLKTGGNVFIGNGNIDFKNKSMLTLNVKTKKANIQNVFHLIPKKWSHKMEALQLNGDIAAEANIQTHLLIGYQPWFSIDYATQNLSINKKDIGAKVHNMKFTGNVTSTDSIRLKYYQMQLNNFSAVINEKDSVQSRSISIRNFKDPILKTSLQIDMNTKTFFDLIKFNKYSDAGGNIHVDLFYNGAANYLVSNHPSTPVINGNIDLKQMNVQLNKLHFGFDDITGKVKFKNDTIKMDQLKIAIGNTDMKLTGTAIHLFNSLYHDTTGLKIDASFFANNFNFSDFGINASSLKHKKNTTPAVRKNNPFVKNGKLNLPYDMQASLTGKVNYIHSGKYTGKNIELKMTLDRESVKINESMKSFGGEMYLSSYFTPIGNRLNCVSKITLRNFHLKQMFASFNNFQQELLKEEHISGSINGNITTTFVMNDALKIDTGSIVIEGDYTIDSLRLRNLEPLLKLTKIGFDEKDMTDVRFEKITSSIFVKKHIMIIPRTLLITKILYFYVDVVVDADGESHFNILFPLKNLTKKPEKLALTNDSKVGLSLPIKINGKAGKLKAQ